MEVPADSLPDHPETDPVKLWYAVYTRSRHEKDVASDYAEFDVECYLPVSRKESRRKDRRMMVDFPLFPGYIFVHEDLTGENGWENKMRVLKSKGVVKILASPGGDPIPIPDQDIFNIRTVLEQNMKVDPYRYDFYAGQPLRIKKGPLSGVEGILVKRRGVFKLILQVHLLCQAVSVGISAADVEAAD